MKATLLLLLIGATSAPLALAADAVDLGAAIGYGCLGCHGIEGYNNVYPTFHVPRLGGQKPAYIEKALHAYKAGDRKHPTMMAQGGSLSDDDIKDLAAWVEHFAAATDTATADSVAGIEVAQTCITCHSATGVAATPETPVLSGQHQDYLKNALKQYREGSRAGTVMSGFAGALSADDIDAVTEYFAGQRGLKTLTTKE